MSSGSSTGSFRSTRSHSSSSSSSSSIGLSEANNESDAFFGNHRPSQKDYESYATLVRHIDKGDTLTAKRILAARSFEKEASGPITVTQQVEEEGASLTKKRGKAAAGGPSTSWPLRPSELGHHPGGAKSVLEDAILAFASAYIRQEQLVHPRHNNAELTTEVVELDELFPAFLPNVIDKVNSLLDNLAAMRPAAQPKQRRQMKPMDWRSVLSAGMLGGLDSG